MTLPTPTGTVSLTNGQTAFTGTGTGFKARDEGDLLVVFGSSNEVGVVVFSEKPTSNYAGTTYPAYGGPSITDGTYFIIPRSANSIVSAVVAQQIQNFLARENVLAFEWNGYAEEEADPGTGKITIDAEAWADAGEAYVSDTDLGGTDRADDLADWEGQIVVSSLERVGIWGRASITAASDESGYTKFTLADLTGTPTFNAGERVGIALRLAGATVDDVLTALGVNSITVSNSAPSGGVNGDIWFQV